MQLQIKPMTALLFGIGFVLALAFLINGRDYSPTKSVAESSHSTVNLSSDTTWQNNRAQLDGPGPEQVTIQQPPTVIVQLPEGVYPSASNSSVSVDLSASETGGWRTPSAPASDEESKSDQASPSSQSDDAYTQEFRTQPPTNDQPTRRECMLAADDIVANGWHGSPVETACFQSEDNLAAINDAYGDLEDENGKGSATNPHPGYATCASEDSPGPCFWNAAEQGNGVGHSFLRDANGSTTYPN